MINWEIVPLLFAADVLTTGLSCQQAGPLRLRGKKRAFLPFFGAFLALPPLLQAQISH